MITAKEVTSALHRALEMKRGGRSVSQMDPADRQLVREQPSRRMKKDDFGEPIMTIIDGASTPALEPNPHAGLVTLSPKAAMALQGTFTMLQVEIDDPSLTRGRARQISVELHEIEEAFTTAKTVRDLTAPERRVQEEIVR